MMVKSKKNAKNQSLIKKLKYLIFDDESIWGWLTAFLAMFIVLKFIFLPIVGLVLNTSLPIVAVISGSMEHRLDVSGTVCGLKPLNYKTSFDNWWDLCGVYYKTNYNITKSEFQEFSLKNGFNIGDVMILYGTKASKLKLGDIIVFEGGRSKPIIHRIVKISKINNSLIFTTKGDHNAESYYFESDITEDDYYGRAVMKIPFVGYVKIIFINIINAILGVFGLQIG